MERLIIELNSSDNYQVKLSKEQVSDNIPILALKRNEEVLNENNIRLVVSGLRDLYWISELKSIRLLKSLEFPGIEIIRPFTDIKGRIRLIENPKPFTKCKGYLFADIVSSLKLKPENPAVTNVPGHTPPLQHTLPAFAEIPEVLLKGGVV